MTKGQIFHLAWNPLFLHFTLFDIQDEFLSLFFVAWILFSIKNKSSWALLIFLSILFLFFSKVLSLLFIVPLYYKNHTKGFLAGFIICLLYLLLYLSGFHIFSFEFERIGAESDRILNIISSGNIFWIVKFLGISVKPNISIFVTAGTLFLANAYLAFNPNRKNIPLFDYYILGILINLLILLILYKMTFPYNYLIFFLVFYIAFYQKILPQKLLFIKYISIFALIVSLNHQTEYLIFKYNLVNSSVYPLYFLFQICIVVFNCFTLFTLIRWVNSYKSGDLS